ncbi:hypothetical protein Cni_G13314 [Canna indica]|uniref:Uncharacterized protein n=1 Tax=Canna indica TaxID=4628 RepID=A0AAQ3K9A8_9LILI|nr:hypothetical protein Cni_G13314 [Canna indica]
MNPFAAHSLALSMGCEGQPGEGERDRLREEEEKKAPSPTSTAGPRPVAIGSHGGRRGRESSVGFVARRGVTGEGRAVWGGAVARGE